MKTSKLDLLRLAFAYDDDFDLADFTPDELDEMLGRIDDGLSVEQIRERYFEYYDDVKDRTLAKHKWSD